MKRRSVLIAVAGLLSVADAYLLMRYSPADDIEVLADMRGFVDLEIGLLNPVFDGPPRTHPPRHPSVALDPNGLGWISNGQRVGDIHSFAYDEPGSVPPIDTPSRYVIVELGDRATFGRALSAMRLLQIQHVCDAAIVDNNAQSASQNEFLSYPMLELKEAKGVNGTCKWR